jgi:transcription antitermination protein NusB
MGKRSTGRKLAMQLIFQVSENIEDLTEEKIDYFLKNEEATDDARELALGFFRGARPHLKEIDALIQKFSHNWPLKRFNRADLAILRLAFYEMAFLKDDPERIIINEAVELAKKFGGEDSFAFVNGILDAYLKDPDNKK